MNLIQVFLEAVESLFVNKLRSVLTVLGIVIGVAAVISMLSIGRGAENAINDQINSIGVNMIYIFSGGEKERNPQPLTVGDAEALADPSQAPAILSVAPVLQGGGQIVQKGEKVYGSIVATTPEYLVVRSLTVAEGQFINATNLEERSAVVVLGSEIALTLFGRTTDVVGETVRVQNQPFRVIGVMESRGGTAFGSEDEEVYVPLTTAQSRLIRRQTHDEIDQIMVQAASAEESQSAVNQINRILARRHRTTLDELDFSTLQQQQILEMTASITGILTIFLGGIGGISLLVGGIGIMNIMYVTVSERTREIGLRKAIGARKMDILVQFLAESAVLSMIGGILGIMLAWGITLLVAQIAANQDVAIRPEIRIDTVLLATLFSAGVGLFFGFYPARRAANLQPVEALRYE